MKNTENNYMYLYRKTILYEIKKKFFIKNELNDYSVWKESYFKKGN